MERSRVPMERDQFKYQHFCVYSFHTSLKNFLFCLKRFGSLFLFVEPETKQKNKEVTFSDNFFPP